MTRGTQCLCVVLAYSLAVPPAFAREHVVTKEVVTQRLAEASAERAAHLRKIDQLLATPEAARAAAARGADITRLRAGLVTLSDSELNDLSRRASALEADPAATGKGALIVVIVLALLVLLAVAIVAGCKEAGAECVDKK